MCLSLLGEISSMASWGDLKFHLKLLLHPIVRVYTCNCAANIVEKYERSLVVG